MQYKSIKLGSLALCMTFIAACSGGAGSGSSSTTRTVTGELDQPNAALTKSLVTDCFADTVIATSSAGTATSSSVESDCSFSMSLAINQSYALSFTQGGTFVATLIFSTGSSSDTGSSMHITSGSSSVDLGLVTISGSTASSSNNPLQYCDSDDDGVDDYDDSDDDDDGIDDSSEDDCDFDGYLDDDDDDSSCTSSSQDGEYIYRVRPFDGSRGNDIDEDVKVYATCAIDSSTVTADTFMVEDSLGNPIDCTYTVSNSDDHNARCRHNDDLFAAGEEYTVTVDGLTCEDTTELAATTWSFTVDNNDDGNDD